MTRRSGMKEALDELLSDLARFSDPSSDMEQQGKGTSVFVRWELRGQPFEAVFHWDGTDFGTVTYDGMKVPLRTFFAGPNLGDLDGLARTIERVRRDDLFIDTRAKRSEFEQASSDPAVTLLNDVISESQDRGTTEITFVTGRAGAGKTRVLHRLVQQRAARFLRREVASLCLYVNAQGRSLARFDEALAVELQALRARLTYDALPVMVRRGLLVPVVDGFDELISIKEGYDAPFASLEEFLGQLDGSGALVVSGRSAYYESEFVQRYARRGTSSERTWSLVPVEVQTWGDEEVAGFVLPECKKSGVGDAEATSVLGQIKTMFRQSALAPVAGLPLFVARMTRVLIERYKERRSEGDASVDSSALEVVPSPTGLVRSLAVKAIEREVDEKLRDRAGRRIITVNQVWGLIAALADEMWTLGTRELDMRTLRELAGFFCDEQSVRGDDRALVIARVPSLPLLEAVPPDRRAFEHELFFGCFLAHSIATFIEERFRKDPTASILRERPSSLAWSLQRNRLPPMAGGLTAETLAAMELDVRAVLRVLASTPDADEAYLRENVGALLHGLMRTSGRDLGPIDGVHFQRVVFADVDLRDIQFENCTFEDVEFRMVNFARTRVLRCRAERVLLVEPLVDPATTRLELGGLDYRTDVLGVRIGEGSMTSSYAPAVVLKSLADCGLPSATEAISKETTHEQLDVNSWVIDTVDQLMFKFQTAPRVYFTDPGFSQLTNDQRWDRLFKAFVDSGVIVQDAHGNKGAVRPYYRTELSRDELMKGLRPDALVDDRVRAFWSMVA